MQVQYGCSVGKYRIGIGGVQPYLCSFSPFWMYHFGVAEYDRDKPIWKDRYVDQIQPILDSLNNGAISTDEAERKLRKVY